MGKKTGRRRAVRLRQARADPERAGPVLLTLILVAAVANLNLAVANVALPSIGAAFDSSQTTLNLIAVGYSLGLAASVLWLGAIGDRYGRKLMLILGTTLAIPFSLLAAYAPSDSVLFVARLGGGLSAGMAFPTTLALITALWSGPGRTKSIALWSGTGGAIAALGPLFSGLLLEHFWWGSVFLITLPLAVVALFLAVRLVPAHVNEATDPVDNLGGILSMLLVGALILGINFAAVPNEGALVAGLAIVAVAAGIAFVIRQRRAANPLYDLHIAGRRVFWVAACAGIIVFGSLMGAMFVGQQFLQDVLAYSTLDAGLAILPAAFLMVLVAPRSAKVVEAKGARFTLLAGYAFCLLGFLTMLLLWNEGSPYWEVGLGYAFIGIGRRLRRNARPRTRSRARFPSNARGWRRGPPISSAISAARSCSRSSARSSRPATRPRSPRRSPPRRTRQKVSDSVEAQLTKSFAGAEAVAQQYPKYAEPDHRGREGVVPVGRPVGVHRGDRRGAARRGARLLHVPQEGRRAATARRVSRDRHEQGEGGVVILIAADHRY